MGHIDHSGRWHGAAFRLVETYDVELGADWSIRLARQPYGELVVIRSGHCRVRLGEHEALVGPGEAFALGRGEPRLTAAERGPLGLFGFGYRVEAVPGGDLSGLLGAPLAIAPVPRRLHLLVERAVRHGESAEPADALRMAIAYACGFSDPAHFSRAFSQRYGESPTATRRRGGAFAEHDVTGHAPVEAGDHRSLAIS